MSIKDNLDKIRSNIPSNVELIVVSKKKSLETIKEAYDAGQRVFAENYVQEFLEKVNSDELRDLQIKWHFIGNLQRNKVKYLVGKVALIQSVSSLRLAEEIDKRASKLSIVQDVLIEVNIGGEKNRGGANIDEFHEIIEGIKNYSNLNLLGLMVIPPQSDDINETRLYFKKAKKLYDEINGLKILSMGMSSDFKEAIKEGSNMIRLGTLVLGSR
jgi:PLP dependent protein